MFSLDLAKNDFIEAVVAKVARTQHCSIFSTNVTLDLKFCQLQKRQRAASKSPSCVLSYFSIWNNWSIATRANFSAHFPRLSHLVEAAAKVTKVHNAAADLPTVCSHNWSRSQHMPSYLTSWFLMFWNEACLPTYITFASRAALVHSLMVGL